MDFSKLLGGFGGGGGGMGGGTSQAASSSARSAASAGAGSSSIGVTSHDLFLIAAVFAGALALVGILWLALKKP